VIISSLGGREFESSQRCKRLTTVSTFAQVTVAELGPVSSLHALAYNSNYLSRKKAFNGLFLAKVVYYFQFQIKHALN